MLRSPMSVPAVALLAAACVTAPTPPPKPFEPPPAAPGAFTAGLIVSSGVASADQQAKALADFVRTATGVPTSHVLFPDYDTLATATAQGKVDVAFLPPIAYVRAKAQGNPELLLKVIRGGQGTNRSVLFAAPGSPYKDLKSLAKGKNLIVAWTDPTSATGYVFAKALLAQVKIDPAGLFAKQEFLQSHDAVCAAVLAGKAHIGATYSNDSVSRPVARATGCRNAMGEKADALTVIAATDDLPHDALAVRAGFPDDAKAKLAAAARVLEKSEAGKRVLAEAFHAEGFAPVSDEEYAPARAALDVFKQ